MNRPTVLGCTGVSIKAWLPTRKALHLFATAHHANGWVHLSGGPHTTANKLAELTHARADGRPVSPFVDGPELRNVLVFD